MAKKRAAVKKKASKSVRARQPTRKLESKRAAKRAVNTSRPRSQRLPLPTIKITALDRHCERVSNIRADMNQLRADEADELRGALREMRMRELITYRYANVELVRVPGEEKLRVRTSKETATAETEPDEETPADEGVAEIETQSTDVH